MTAAIFAGRSGGKVEGTLAQACASCRCKPLPTFRPPSLFMNVGEAAIGLELEKTNVGRVSVMTLAVHSGKSVHARGGSRHRYLENEGRTQM